MKFYLEIANSFKFIKSLCKEKANKKKKKDPLKFQLNLMLQKQNLQKYQHKLLNCQIKVQKKPWNLMMPQKIQIK